MTLLLNFHGGMCCGVKHIINWPDKVHKPGTKPVYHGSGTYKWLDSGFEPALDQTNFRDTDDDGGTVSSDVPFFTHAAPAETTTERLWRYIDFLAKYRSGGIVEVILTYWQKNMWEETLKGIGFKEIDSFINSNTDNKLTMYHLKMTNGWSKEWLEKDVLNERGKEKGAMKAAPFRSTS